MAVATPLEPRRLEAALPPDTRAALQAHGPQTVVVGVHALNQARTVRSVLETWEHGLVQGRAPGFRKALLLLVDAGSGDGTVEAACEGRDAAGPVPFLAARLPATARRGQALLAILAAAARLEARGCAVVDAGLISADPGWVEAFLGPVLDGAADGVLPGYVRSITEGTLTTNLLAPLVHVLTGRRIDEVLGGCCALSGTLVEELLARDEGAGDQSGAGAEMRLVVETLLARDAVAIASLGRKQIDPGVAPPDVSQTVVDVVGPLFQLFERHAEAWQTGRRGAPVRRLGTPPAIRPTATDLNVDRMVRAFRLGLKDLLPVWEQVMPEETLGQLYPLGLLAPDEFVLPPPLWARVVGDFLVGYHERRLPRDHLLRALTPLYLGRVAAFVRETQTAPPARIPGLLEAVGRAFEPERASLAARWR
jgi:hypothetical protein